MTFTTQKQPRAIYLSARIRLTDSQRLQLKEAYSKQSAELQKPQQTVAASGLQVTTTFGMAARDGLADLTIRDLLTTRESISVGVILKLQKILEVQVLSREELSAACTSYLDYVFSA